MAAEQGDARLDRNVREEIAPVLEIQGTVGHVRDQDVQQTVMFQIRDKRAHVGYSLAPFAERHPHFKRFVDEVAFAIVHPAVVGHGIIGDENVDFAVAIDIRQRHGHAPKAADQARVHRFGKVPLAVVEKKPGATADGIDE